MTIFRHHDPGQAGMPKPPSGGWWGTPVNTLTNLHFPYNVSRPAAATELIWDCPAAGQVSGFRVRISTLPGSGSSVTVDLKKNGASVLGFPLLITSGSLQDRWQTASLGVSLEVDDQLTVVVATAGGSVGTGLQTDTTIQTDDMPDQRYLIKAIRPDTSSARPEGGILQWTIIEDTTDAEYRQVIANNIEEMVEGTHRLPTDGSQAVWVYDDRAETARSYLSPGKRRYWFQMGSVLVAVVGGQFLAAGSTRSSGIVKRTGVQRLQAYWSTANPETDAFPWSVNAEIEFEGEVYVAGSLTIEPGNNAITLAKWDGMDWIEVDSGLDISVNALAIFEGKLIAAGASFAGNHIRQFDGSSWSDVGTFDGAAVIFALEVWDEVLYVGGTWVKITAAGDDTWSIVSWDGDSFSGVGGGVNDDTPSLATGDIFDFAIHDDGAGEALFVVGEFLFIDAGGTPIECDNVGRVTSDGVWSSADFDEGIVHGAVGFDDGTNDDLFIVGVFDRMWRWNGTSWAAVSGTFAGTGIGNPRGYKLEVWRSKLIVVGVFEGIGGAVHLGVAMWDLTDGWQAFLGGVGVNLLSSQIVSINAARSVFVDAEDNPIIGFDAVLYANRLYALRIAILTVGGGWRPLGRGVSGAPAAAEETQVFDAVIRKGRIYACGNFDTLLNRAGHTPATVSSTGVGYWYGGEWHATPGLPSESVRRFAEFDDGTNGNELYVVTEQTGVYKLDEETDTWSEVGDLQTLGPPSTLIAFDDKLWVGGEGVGIGVPGTDYIASYTLAGGWVTDNTGLPAGIGRVRAFAVWNNALYAGIGAAFPDKAVWKMLPGGSSWSEVGTLASEVFGLAARNVDGVNELVAVGTLHDPPGISIGRFATFDGSAWGNHANVDQAGGHLESVSLHSRQAFVVYGGLMRGVDGSGDRALNVGAWDGAAHGFAVEQHEGTLNGLVLRWL